MYSNTLQTLTKFYKVSLLVLFTGALVFFLLATPVLAHAAEVVAPTDVSVQANDEFVILAWTSLDNSAIHYTLQRSTTGDLADAVVTDAPILSSTSTDSPEVYLSFMDTRESPDAIYTYWIVATDDSNQSTVFGPYPMVQNRLVFLPLVAK
jgi:hypothetical protein